MNDKLSELLASLPREKASENFTAHVLQRIETSTAPRPIPRWRGSAPLLAVAALLLLALSFGGREFWHHHQRQETVARLEALRAEHAALELELRRLRRLAMETRPVLYLGGDETVEYVVDLSRSHRNCVGAACTKLASRDRTTQSTASLPTSPKKERPDLPTASPSLKNNPTEITDLSPKQLRQHPRQVY